MRKRNREKEKHPDYLSPARQQVNKLLLEGINNKEIGRRMGITEKAVKSHLTVIYCFFGVTTRHELIVKQYQEKIKALRGDEPPADPNILPKGLLK